MKVIALSFMLAIVSMSCGDEEAEEAVTRIVNPATLLVGPANGYHRVTIENHPPIAFPASGFMTMRLPKGIFEGRPFPGDVTFTVATSQDDVLSGQVSFPRLTFLDANRFEGSVNEGDISASIVGSLISTTTQTVVQVEGFGYSLPVSQGISSSRVALQSEQLIEHTFEAVP